MADTNKIPEVLIGLYGNKGVGKDTIGQILKLGHGYFVFSFAGHLYDCVAKLFHVRVEALQARETKEANMPALYGMSPRQVLKMFGTEWVRDFVSKDFWLNEVARRITDTCRSRRDSTKVVITDVAMLNEIKYVLDNGGYILYIVRPGCDEVRVRDREAGIAETFLSTLLLEEHAKIVRVENDGSTDDLINRMNAVVQYIALNSFKSEV